MRIYFDNVNFQSRTGPNSFALRLAHQLSIMGHTLADHDQYDVALVFVEATRLLDRKKPYVHRLDGFWMKPLEFEAGKNRAIISAYTNAAAVVYQSNFDRAMALRWLGQPCRQSNSEVTQHVIPNGAPIKSRAELSAGLRTLPIRTEHDEVFVCSANWHPQKRLNDNIQLFRHIRRDSKRSCLIIMGDHPGMAIRAKADDRIFYAGSLVHEDCLALYAMSDWMLHLAWLDHCPNTVVEAMSVGTPVICTNAGGTVELLSDRLNDTVTKRGFSIDECHDMSLADYDCPPDITKEISAIDHLPHSWPKFDVTELDIAHCAKRYEDVLKSVL